MPMTGPQRCRGIGLQVSELNLHKPQRAAAIPLLGEVHETVQEETGA